MVHREEEFVPCCTALLYRILDAIRLEAGGAWEGVQSGSDHSQAASLEEIVEDTVGVSGDATQAHKGTTGSPVTGSEALGMEGVADGTQVFCPLSAERRWWTSLGHRELTPLPYMLSQLPSGL